MKIMFDSFKKSQEATVVGVNLAIFLGEYMGKEMPEEEMNPSGSSEPLLVTQIIYMSNEKLLEG